MMKLKTQSHLKVGPQRPLLKGSEALVLNAFNELVKYGLYKYTKHALTQKQPFFGMAPISSRVALVKIS